MHFKMKQEQIWYINQNVKNGRSGLNWKIKELRESYWTEIGNNQMTQTGNNQTQKFTSLYMYEKNNTKAKIYFSIH